MIMIGADWVTTIGVGTRKRLTETAEERQQRLNTMSGAVKTLLECMGEDPAREGLLKTPERYAKAMMFFTRGYEESVDGNSSRD
jgi:GTP cyclohydrolase I